METAYSIDTIVKLVEALYEAVARQDAMIAHIISGMESIIEWQARLDAIVNDPNDDDPNGDAPDPDAQCQGQNVTDIAAVAEPLFMAFASLDHMMRPFACRIVSAREWPAILRECGDKIVPLCNHPLPLEQVRIICDNINHHDYGDCGRA